jgi:hypothetical protein
MTKEGLVIDQTGSYPAGIPEGSERESDKIPDNMSTESSTQLLIAGLNHDDEFVRSGALTLLSDDRDPGIEATHAAISAIERYGWYEAYEYSHFITRLPLDGEAVDRMAAWILEDHAAEPDKLPPRLHLLEWFAKGPIDLFPRWTAALGIDLEKESKFDLGIARDRADLRSRSADECLALLDQVLHDCATAGSNFPHRLIGRIDRLCERLAEEDLPRDSDLAASVLYEFDPSLTEVTFEDYRAGAALITMRHQRRLSVPVDAVIRLFDLDWDWMNEKISHCLSKAADREDILGILRLFPGLPWYARLYLCSALENNRHPGLEEEIAGVAAKEPSSELRYHFAYVLAAYGTPETREAARRLIASLPPSPEKEPVQRLLYVWGRLLGEEWEELDRWQAKFEREKKLLENQQFRLQHMDIQWHLRTPEELLQHLAETPPYHSPKVVLEKMIERLDEMIPALLGVLERFVEAPESFDVDRDWLTLTTAAFLLAQARETRAFQPLVALLSLPHDQVRELWDEMLADSMGRILASVYDGDESALRGLIENPEIEEYARGSAAIQCLEALVEAGHFSREDLETYYAELLESKLEKSPALVWDSICLSVSHYGFVSLLPAVKKAFAEEICNPAFNSLEEIVAAIGKTGAPSSFNTSLIDDTIAEFDGWACFQPENDPDYWDFPEDFSGPSRPTFTAFPVAPYVRESPKIGRNDPCPCGSGKKYKKCCG